MTRRDLAWRLLGAGLLATASGTELMLDAADSLAKSRTIIPAFIVAIAGLVLMIQGKRIPIAMRAECSRHSELASAIHARRRRVRARFDTTYPAARSSRPTP